MYLHWLSAVWSVRWKILKAKCCCLDLCHRGHNKGQACCQQRMNVSNHVKPTYFLEARTLSAILTTCVSGSEKNAEVLGFRFERPGQTETSWWPAMGTKTLGCRFCLEISSRLLCAWGPVRWPSFHETTPGPCHLLQLKLQDQKVWIRWISMGYQGPGRWCGVVVNLGFFKLRSLCSIICYHLHRVSNSFFADSCCSGRVAGSP